MDSQLGDDINLYFVIPDHFADQNECPQIMWDAFNRSDQCSIETSWIKASECLTKTFSKSDVLVLKEFEGETFEYLKKNKCLILGPLCLVQCLETGEALPDGTSPVFNIAMKNMVFSISGFPSKEKEKMKIKIEYMGGLVIKQLRHCNTHLVTNSMMTAKYEAAAKSGQTIVTDRWVQEVWEANLQKYVSASDAQFDAYKCPIFLNLLVTTTLLDKYEKREIVNLIERNGGTHSGSLNTDHVKIILTKDNGSTSEKLKCGMQNKIPCLKYTWVRDSLKAGYALPLDDYCITSSTSTRTCSTPEKTNAQPALDWSTISAINNDGNVKNVIHETIQETFQSTCTTFSEISTNIPSNLNLDQENSVLNKISIEDARKAGPFLDGCNIYLVGFSLPNRDKLNKIIRFGSATRMDDLSEDLTHVIVGDPQKAVGELKRVYAKNITPFVVHVQWLLESLKIKKPAPELAFLCQPKNEPQTPKPVVPSSPLSKKNVQMLQKPRIISNVNISISTLRSPEMENCESDVLMKFLQKPSSNSKSSAVESTNASITVRTEGTKTPEISTPKSTKNDSTNVTKNDSTNVTKNASPKNVSCSKIEETNVSCIPPSQGLSTGKMFHGLKFSVIDLELDKSENITVCITSQGGQIVNQEHSKEMVDFAIVPFNTSCAYNAREKVTYLYIDACVEQNQKLDVEYFHKPVSVLQDVKPLKNCSIAMSTYSGVHREFFQKLCIELGAIYQDTFARTSRPNVTANTHLICPIPDGKKYAAAVKWNLPAVTGDWLLECAKKLEHVDETPFLVGESRAPEKPKTLIQTPESTKHETPKMINLEKTPKAVINKRLASVMNQDPAPALPSPFHVDTPKSPYGRVFGNENPSAETRKDFYKWSEHLPDFNPKPKKPPKRYSTPLSELKKKLLQNCRRGAELEANETESTEDSDLGAASSIASDFASLKRKLSYSDDNETPEKSSKMAKNARSEEMSEALKSASNFQETLSLEKQSHVDRIEPDNPAKYSLMESQKDVIGWEALDYVPSGGSSNSTNSTCPKKRKFMLSGVQERNDFEQIIRDLGGEVSTDANFDSTATHLVCLKACKNEKMLGCVASGKWILHLNYLVDSKKIGHFLDEEDYEFGNPKSRAKIPNITKAEEPIAEAAHRWRLKLQNSKMQGAFENMVAILMVHKDKYVQFKRLILAGNGDVVQAKPPYDSSKKITHCFIQTKQLEHSIDYATLANKGILCFSPSFLGDHLIKDQPVDLALSVLPEFKKYLSLIPQERLRN